MIILQAALWTSLATATLLVGTWIAFTFHLSSKLVGLIMGFGGGALIGAAAYELFPEATRDWLSFVFLALGAIVFYLGTLWIERRSPAEAAEDEGAQAQAAGQTIVLGTLLDCVPECLTLGMSIAILGAPSMALLVAMLVATLPMTIGASSMMEGGGMSRRKIYGIWLFVMLVCVISGAVGALLIQLLPQLTGIYVMAAAAGALIAMTTVSMIPEALKATGMAAGLTTVLGFAFSAMLGVIG